jgi:hypothetical protein
MMTGNSPVLIHLQDRSSGRGCVLFWLLLLTNPVMRKTLCSRKRVFTLKGTLSKLHKKRVPPSIAVTGSNGEGNSQMTGSA